MNRLKKENMQLLGKKSIIIKISNLIVQLIKNLELKRKSMKQKINLFMCNKKNSKLIHEEKSRDLKERART